jgi:hypothetical protein
MAADSGLSQEKIVSRLRKTLQISHTAKTFQMPKFDLQRFSFHYEENIKPLFLELQAKKWISKIEFNSYSCFGLNLEPSCFLTSLLRQQDLHKIEKIPAIGFQGSSLFGKGLLKGVKEKGLGKNSTLPSPFLKLNRD